jgi:glutathione S-transferase
VVHWLLLELGESCDLQLVDFASKAQKSPEYLRLNPSGVVPALVLDDGQVLTESGAIVMHLADTHPEARLAPAVGRLERARD